MTDAMPRLSLALADRYRIERELGAGGMATVYLAEDLKHKRHVALKVLRPELAAVLGAERFVQEITTTAALQHPHILPLFDSGTADGFLYYVMPFIDGETLRGKLTRETQLGIEESVQIARDVASALHYAHEHGVIHRDIKPENILLHDGRPMVADFGIALAVSAAAGGRMTETGLSLGTPHYMSPEQATAEKEISARSDVYSLGSVLYEMLSGEPPHMGNSAQQIIMKIITEEAAPVTRLRKSVPLNVAATVAKSLAKLPADRFASAKAFAEALVKSDFTFGTLSAAAGTSGRPTTRQQALRGAPWMLALAGIATSVWLATHQPQPVPPPIARFALHLTPEVSTNVTGQVIAVAPDGSRIVFVGATTGGSQLFTRTLDQVDPVLLPGGNNAVSPFFSATGQYLGFASGSRLVKIAVGGGPVLPIAEVGSTFFGGTWSEQDVILFADEAGLHLVPAAGGQPTLVAAPDSGSRETYRWPEFLPGGRTAVFAINDGSVDRLAAITLSTGAIRRLDVIGSNPHYVSQGYLTFAMIPPGAGTVASGTLLMTPFDPGSLSLLGDPVPVADSVQVGVNSRTAKLGISRNGTTVFASGAVGLTTLVSIGRDGTARDLGAEPRFYQSPRLSPDGRHIALHVFDVGTDIWVFNLAGKTLSRLTFEATARVPNWTPDSRHIIYTRGGTGPDLARVPADGSAPAESLLVASGDQYSGDVTPDGRTMVIREISGGRRRISVVALDSARAVRPLIATGFDNYSPSLSPDGRWVAYVSDESGRNEVYVRPFPGAGGKWQVSKDGGAEPRWSPTGREIFFRTGSAMMAAAVQAGTVFAPGEIRELFRATMVSTPYFTGYDVTRDGLSFIMVQSTSSNTQTVVVLLNWFDNLPARPR